MEIKINDTPWLFTTTGGATFFVDGVVSDYFVDYADRTIVVCTARGPDAAALAAAEAIAFISQGEHQPSPHSPDVPCRRVVRFSGCFLTGLRYPAKLDPQWRHLQTK